MDDYRQDCERLGSLRTAYPSIPWIVLTHNASTNVSDDIVKKLKLNRPVAEFRQSSFRNNLFYDIIFKNTIVSNVVDHLKKYVISCLDSGGDDNANDVIFIFHFFY